MMKKILLLTIVLLSLSSAAQTTVESDTLVVDTAKYWPVLIDRAALDSACRSAHPVYFKLFSPGTLYGDAVRQAVFCDDVDGDGDATLTTNAAINRQLVKAFVSAPWLFSTTQTAISGQHTVADLSPEAPSSPQPQPQAPVADAQPVEVGEDIHIDIKAEKPNFWKFDGSGSLQFTQTHFSDNWYQGGESNYSMLALLTLHAKYDNKQKLQWETTLDAKLGFQTVENDEYRKFRSNNDQLRLTSKVGYRASKYWYYTVQGEATTQFTKSYVANQPDCVGDFLSPLKTVISVGMDYKLERKTFTGSAYLAPIAMTWMYVDRIDLATRYGNDEGKHSRITWGPNVTINYTWKPWTNFEWKARLYYFSNFEYVNLEWENTFTFTFNKYVNAKLFVYPRFDDSSLKYRTEHGSYLMFKEYMSLGLSYSF